jgi:hypothetical protein
LTNAEQAIADYKAAFLAANGYEPSVELRSDGKVLIGTRRTGMALHLEPFAIKQLKMLTGALSRMAVQS